MATGSPRCSGHPFMKPVGFLEKRVIDAFSLKMSALPGNVPFLVLPYPI